MGFRHSLRALISTAMLVFPAVQVIAAEKADWNYYGLSGDGKYEEYLFFDQAGVKSLPGGHLQVWTEGVYSFVLENQLDDITGKDILEKTAEKIALGYQPSFSAIMPLTHDQILNITMAETRANAGISNNPSRALYELDCATDRVRELSIHIEKNGERRDRDTPSPWHNVSPETNGAWLLALACQKHP